MGAFDFTGKRVLVTGASHGIGFAVARAFAACRGRPRHPVEHRGHRRGGRADETDSGRPVRALICDITEPRRGQALAEIAGVVSQALAQFARGRQHVESLDARLPPRVAAPIREQVRPGPFAQPSTTSVLRGRESAARPPRALPSVPVKMSMRSMTPFSSAAPRPLAPRWPVAWHSSMSTAAPYRPPGGDLVELRRDAVHREHAVAGDHVSACAVHARLLELRLQVRHVAWA